MSFAHLRVTVPDRVIARAVDGMTVLLDVETGHTFTLDDVGSRAWILLTSSASVQQAYETLLHEYTVEPEQLRDDLKTLIDDLGTRHLLEVCPA